MLPILHHSSLATSDVDTDTEEAGDVLEQLGYKGKSGGALFSTGSAIATGPSEWMSTRLSPSPTALKGVSSPTAMEVPTTPRRAMKRRITTINAEMLQASTLAEGDGVADNGEAQFCL